MRLRLTGPTGERREFDTKGKSRLDIGRSDDNDVSIASITISRYHCRVVLPTDSKPIIEDLGSRYGTRVNNVPIMGPTVLNEDDQFLIGSWVGQLVRIPHAEDSTGIAASPGASFRPTSTPLPLETPPLSLADFDSSPTNPSVWTTSHKIIIGVLGLVAVALLVYIFVSNS